MPKVFLSAGHGGPDPGAVGNGLEEADINLDIMLACRDVLEAHGFEVVCSRVVDENDPVQEEVREANASGADVAVSFHTNAGGGDGSESFYYAGSAEGQRLAQLCEDAMVAIGQNSRGIKTNNLMFTRETNMTAVLCECAFIDSNDIQIADTKAERQIFGEAYASAILEYFGVEKMEDDMPTPKDIWDYVYNGHTMAERLYLCNVMDYDTSDPTGRDVKMNDHDHIKYIAAKQAAMEERQMAMEEVLNKIYEKISEEPVEENTIKE